MKPFTPAKVKADIIFIGALVAVFVAPIPDSISVALIGAAGLIAAALNVGESLIEKYAPSVLPSALGEIKTVQSEADKLIPIILPILQDIPGKIGQEVRQALELIAKGPVTTESETAGKREKKA